MICRSKTPTNTDFMSLSEHHFETCCAFGTADSRRVSPPPFSKSSLPMYCSMSSPTSFTPLPVGVTKAEPPPWRVTANDPVHCVHPAGTPRCVSPRRSQHVALILSAIINAVFAISAAKSAKLNAAKNSGISTVYAVRRVAYLGLILPQQFLVGDNQKSSRAAGGLEDDPCHPPAQVQQHCNPHRVELRNSSRKQG